MFVLIILTGWAVAYLLLKKNKKPDYYSLFTIGVIWLVVGVPFGNYCLYGMGAVFLLVALAHKRKWKQHECLLNEVNSNKTAAAAAIGGIIAVLLAVAAFFIAGFK